jgi:hypothetical protein
MSKSVLGGLLELGVTVVALNEVVKLEKKFMKKGKELW